MGYLPDEGLITNGWKSRIDSDIRVMSRYPTRFFIPNSPAVLSAPHSTYYYEYYPSLCTAVGGG